jgi:predicted nucleic acid-binding protein
MAITVTQAARNFADCINRARYQEVTFVLLKNRTAVAQIVPSSEKDIFNLRGWLESRAEDRFQVAAITIAELWHGVERASGPHRAGRKKYHEAVGAVLPVIAYTEERAYFHARIWSSLDVSRKIIRAYDLIVAATA